MINPVISPVKPAELPPNSAYRAGMGHPRNHTAVVLIASF
jgi:hypothetical protein